MAPGVSFIRAVTPGFPLPATPTGKLTDLPAPGPFFHSSLIALRCEVKTKVVPLPSERLTTVILVSGRLTPGLVLVIVGSFQLVILPRKIPTYASRESLRSVVMSGRL